MADIEGLPDPYEGERLDRDARLSSRAYREGFAAGRATATPGPPDEAAIRSDERERLSARVYENGWCPTCAHKADPDAMPPHEVAAILVDPAEVLSPEEVAEYERCQQSVIDARRRAPMVEGQMIVGAAATPDERLREAVAALPQYVITIQDREGYTYERGCEGQPMNYTGVMLADVEALVGGLKDRAPTARETTDELKDSATDRGKPEER